MLFRLHFMLKPQRQLPVADIFSSHSFHGHTFGFKASSAQSGDYRQRTSSDAPSVLLPGGAFQKHAAFMAGGCLNHKT
jgi:hypothetical protein